MVEPEKFVVDAMLGKLAKWLRVLGYDTRYESCKSSVWEKEKIKPRWVLTRNTSTARNRPEAILLYSDHVAQQLAELRKKIRINPHRSQWFTRCLVCNTPLERPQPESEPDNVPEYVYYHNRTAIRYCPTCKQYFWPGSHRSRMLHQLKAWGF